MSNGLTTPRKLHQINWNKGVTDKDIRPGYVAQLINVEIRTGDSVESRDGLSDIVPAVAIPTPSPSRFVRINGDPSNRFPDGWMLFVSSTTVYIIPWGYDIDHADAKTFTFNNPTELENTEVAIVGSSIYMATTTDGDANSVVGVFWSAFEGRFTSPGYIDSGSPYYGVEDSNGEWVLVNLNNSPLINTFVNLDPDDARESQSAQTELAMDWLEENQEFGVAISITTQWKDTFSQQEPAFEDRVAMEFYVVFTHSDGSLSMPSNGITVDLFRDDFFNIGYNILISKNISQSVSGVRLYRKLLTDFDSNTGEHDLVIAAPLFLLDNDEDTFKRSHFETGNISYTDPTPPDGDLDAEFYEHSVPQASSGVKINDTSHSWENVGSTLSHKVSTDDITRASMRKTHGWMKAQAREVMMFCPEHFYREGNVSLKWSGAGPYFYAEFTNCLRITDRISLAGRSVSGYDFSFEMIPALIHGGGIGEPALIDNDDSNSTLISLPHTGPSGNHENINDATVDYRGYREMGDLTVTDYGHENFIQGGSHSVTYGTPSTIYPYDAFGMSYALFNDIRSPKITPSVESEFGGVDLGDVVDVRPYHIGAAGGRLFGLNILVDGVYRPAELMYTQFGNLGTFASANYISYGVRDDGIGVAISNIKSFILAHHTSATYVFDISGGSDFTWREIGSYNAGLIKNDLTCVTQYGVFWCGYMGLHAFNGRGVETVSDEIEDRYRELVGTALSLTYREDLKQLWLCCENGRVLVYDLPTRAWHDHYFTEYSVFRDGGARNLFTNGIDVYINASENDFYGNEFFKLDKTSITPFVWGIDTGYDTMGIPEIIKKIRRVYLYAVRDEPFNTSEMSKVTINSYGDEGGEASIDDYLVDDKQIRQSASVRGYATRVLVLIESGAEFWRGKLDSLGISYKPKKLK